MSLAQLSPALALLALAPNDDVWVSKEIREAQTKYGSCVVRNHYSEARKLVLNPNLKGGEYDRARSWSTDDACFAKAANPRYSAEMSFPNDSLRYALADALFQKEFSRGGPTSFEDVKPIEQPDFDDSEFRLKPRAKKKEVDDLAKSRADRLALVSLAHYGECVVRADASHSRALLMASPDSAQEAAAFSALKSAFSECLSQGQNVEFNKSTLRGTIALNYYRLANASRGTVQAEVTK